MDEIGHSLGKHFSLNVPLQDGIDNESYVALFKSIMEPTINTFAPSSIVLQCGADSLGCDRLGCFNLSIAAHGECVRFIKAFNIPLLVLGGGGYTIKNVSRCWTYETAVLLDLHQDLPNSLPHTIYDDFYAPDWKLHPDLVAGRNRIENLNSRKSLEKIRIGILERLRFIHGAPSVAMSEIPPSLTNWMADEEELEEEERGGEDAPRKADDHRGKGEWFDNDGDRENDGQESISTLAPLILNGSTSTLTSRTPRPPRPSINSSTSTSTRGRGRKKSASNSTGRSVGRPAKGKEDFESAAYGGSNREGAEEETEEEE